MPSKSKTHIPLPKQICARVKCSRSFTPLTLNTLFCSTSCRVLDWQAKKGRVVAWVRTDPETGKLFLYVPLDKVLPELLALRGPEPAPITTGAPAKPV